MADPVEIPETREPSFINRHLVTGAKIGALPVLGAAIATFAAVGSGVALPAIVSYAMYALGTASVVGGAIAGGYYGKERIDENLARDGLRSIHPPRMFNEGMVQGSLNGLILGLAATAAAVFFTPAASALFPWIVGAAAGAGLLATASLGYIQGNDHQQKMAADYKQAQVISAQLQRGGGLGMDGLLNGLNNSKANDNAITSEDMAKLNAKLSERKCTTALEALGQRREEAAEIPDELAR